LARGELRIADQVFCHQLTRIGTKDQRDTDWTDGRGFVDLGFWIFDC
jgi:hypothetical protein